MSFFFRMAYFLMAFFGPIFMAVFSQTWAEEDEIDVTGHCTRLLKATGMCAVCQQILPSEKHAGRRGQAVLSTATAKPHGTLNSFP